VTVDSPHVRSRWVAVTALLALAAIVRASAMFYGTLSADDATIALIAKHFLSGENFPVFFYRQTYMRRDRSRPSTSKTPGGRSSGPSCWTGRRSQR
jgi:hypothetical protein